MKVYAPGTEIGQYRVLSDPMLGGMGVVYICHDLVNDRPVALKTFKPEYLPDRAARDRFLREGTAWVELGRHPHIVRCYEVTPPGVSLEVYLVLELIAKAPGREDASLRSWLVPGHSLQVDQALLFALQIARGMGHATRCIPGFVHRDLKPENVLVGADRLAHANVNCLRVTDFGLAAVVEAGSKEYGVEIKGVNTSQESSASSIEHPASSVPQPVTRTQLTQGIAGTPLYMAPEQWRGESVSVATDVYALGCILVEMLTGQWAVRGKSVSALMRAHCAGKVQPLPNSVPQAVRKVVARCVAVEPGERYGAWDDVEVALAEVYTGATGQAAPAPEPAQALSQAERVAVGWSYNAMGGAYSDIGKPRVAAGYFERVVAAGKTEGEQRLEAAGLGNLGNAYFYLGDYRRAIAYNQQQLALAREILDQEGECNALGSLGLAYGALGDHRRAIEYHQQYLAFAREIGDREGEGGALGNLGSAYFRLGDYHHAIVYYEQHLTLAREIGDRQGEGSALGNLGNAHLFLGDYHHAAEFYQQHLAIAREIGDRQGEGRALGNLGNAHFQLGDSRKAVEFYEQRLDIARETGDRSGEGTVLFNLSLSLKDLGDDAQAVARARAALALFEQIGSPYADQVREQLAEWRKGE